ncbi:MAG: hypothetical protein D6748_12860 [Calditrichaeota bacterium]|nr:MAG: hypothetical protein D6748_12860 [Calditrichota bacterium]
MYTVSSLKHRRVAVGINRRDFLKQGAFLLAAASQAGWISKAVTAQDEPMIEAYPGAGIETWKCSVCRLCPGGCGIKVRLVDGRPVKIEGNPLSPVNRGGLCPAGHAGLQVLFNSDRISTPLKRVGERGENRWEAISWEEALQLFYDYLLKLRNEKTPHHLLVLDGESRGLQKRLLERFLEAYGTPNYFNLSSQEPSSLPFLLMHGRKNTPGYDFQNTRFILSFGNDFLDSEGPPSRMAYLFGELRQNPGRNRVKIVQIDPRLSTTAVKADRWIPLNPGTYGALALGVAHIMVVEGLYNKTFVENHTFGFEDWVDNKGNSHIGFKTLLLKEYYPEKVSGITGVPIDDIIRVARSFAENQPGIAIWGRGVTNHSNALFSQMAIHALNALVGSINSPGGILEAPPEPPTGLPPLVQDKLAQWGSAQSPVFQYRGAKLPATMESLAYLLDNIQSGEPYPIEVALLIHTNPLFELPEKERFQKALEKIPFVVSFSSEMDESSIWADLILPDHTYLEKWDLDYEVPQLPFTQVTISQPIIQPRFNTRHIGDVILSCARLLGGSVQKSLPETDYRGLVQKEAEALFRSHRGFITSGQFEDFFQSFLSRRGFKYQEFATFEEFWEALLKEGSWLEIPQPVSDLFPRLSTPSGKFEFFSQTFYHQYKALPHHVQNVLKSDSPLSMALSKGDQAFLPHFEEPNVNGDSIEYPYFLYPFSILTLFDGKMANRPLLMEMVGFRRNVQWDSWAEINPETARELNIRHGDWIWIESPRGRVKVRAHLYPGAMPGMVYLPLGLGHTASGKYASQKGVNPNDILVFDYDPLGGSIARNSTRVKIYKASVA